MALCQLLKFHFLCAMQCCGKSTVMKAMTGRELFLTGTGATTRAPVRVELRNISPEFSEHVHVSVHFGDKNLQLQPNDNLAAIVKSMMDTIPHDTFQEEEIVVKIAQPNVPNLTLIDIPGLSTDPQTHAIARHYIERRNTLVICLVDAGYVDLASHEVAGMVRQAGKLSNAMLVLTRTDEVTTQAIKSKVLDRLLYSSREMNLTGFRRDNVFAVTAQMPPAEVAAGLSERNLFQRQILDLLPELGAPYKDQAVYIETHCTTANLVRALVPWYEDFIKKVGIPSALSSLHHELSLANQVLEELGEAVDKLTVKEVMEEICSLCNIQAAAKILLRKEVSGQMQVPAIIMPEFQGMPALPDYIARPMPPEHEVLARAQQQHQVASATLHAISLWLGHGGRPAYYTLILDMISLAIAQSSPLRLERFEDLIQKVHVGLLQAIDPQAVERAIFQHGLIKDLLNGFPDVLQEGET